MKKLFMIGSMVFAFVASPVFASGPGDSHDDGHGQGFENGQGHQSHGQGKGLGHHKSAAVPEIDAAGTALAIALLGGVVSIARERRKNKV